MVNVGIYCPDWIFGYHNTDHKVVKMFGRLNEFAAVKTVYVASKSYTLSFNLNKMLQRICTSKQFLSHGIREDETRLDLIYHYGHPLHPKPFFETVKDYPVFITSGFMTDRYVTNVFGKLINRQKEADEIANAAGKADMLHFHTRGEMNRFLHYRPDFAEKTVAIPFFLPNLNGGNNSAPVEEAKPEIHILFVGSHGIRKGLLKLIEALDLLGSWYLNAHHVVVTIVSKDKPRPKSSFKLKWFTKLSHCEVLRFMQAASIFVLVPENESYGLVLIEAMNAGCAIITDDDEPRTEIIGDAGIMLPSQSAKSIANAIKQLVENGELRTELGRRAVQRATEYFHPNVVAQQYNNCFRLLIKVQSNEQL